MENELTNLEKQMVKEISHGICVSNLAYRVAGELGLPEDECYEMAVAGMLHDVGKLEVTEIYLSEGGPAEYRRNEICEKPFRPRICHAGAERIF